MRKLNHVKVNPLKNLSGMPLIMSAGVCWYWHVTGSHARSRPSEDPVHVNFTTFQSQWQVAYHDLRRRYYVHTRSPESMKRKSVDNQNAMTAQLHSSPSSSSWAAVFFFFLSGGAVGAGSTSPLRLRPVGRVFPPPLRFTWLFLTWAAVIAPPAERPWGCVCTTSGGGSCCVGAAFEEDAWLALMGVKHCVTSIL